MTTLDEFAELVGWVMLEVQAQLEEPSDEVAAFADAAGIAPELVDDLLGSVLNAAAQRADDWLAEQLEALGLDRCDRGHALNADGSCDGGSHG